MMSRAIEIKSYSNYITDNKAFSKWIPDKLFGCFRMSVSDEFTNVVVKNMRI